MTGPVNRRCGHPGCGKLGHFGTGVHLLRGIPGAWWCREHLPDETEPVAAVKPPSGGQMKLL